MKKYGTPMTREGYLSMAYGESPPELDAEGEAALPQQFRRGPQ